MSAPRKVIVVKIPREDPIIDKPIGFGNLKNLHLELIENKKKLKKNIPTVSVRKKEIIQPPPEPTNDEIIEEEDPLVDFAPTQPQSAVAALVAATEKKTASSMIENIQDPLEVENVSNENEGETLEVDENVEEEEDVEKEEENEEQEKENYIHKFNILARRYPTRTDIPTYTEHDDLDTMKRMYDRTMKELSLENRVTTYRKILSYSFLAIEILAKYMKIDMTDFASTQNATISDYDSMLVELGEKSHGSIFDSIPVEAKLIGMILFNTFAFWIMKNKNIDINKFYNFAAAKLKSETTPTEEEDEEIQKPKRKMKGPSLKK